MSIFKQFEALYGSLPTVTFNPEWRNGTSYYDHICDDPDLVIPEGHVYRSQDESPNHRRIVIVGLAQGLKLAVFERFTPYMGCPEVLVSNAPHRRTASKLGVEVPNLDRAFQEEDWNTFLGLITSKVYYFVESLDGFDKLDKVEIEYGEISPAHFEDMEVVSDSSVLKPGDRVYSLDAGAYNLYLIK